MKYTKTKTIGVPQGSLLSPLLFVLAEHVAVVTRTHAGDAEPSLGYHIDIPAGDIVRPVTRPEDHASAHLANGDLRLHISRITYADDTQTVGAGTDDASSCVAGLTRNAASAGITYANDKAILISTSQVTDGSVYVTLPHAASLATSVTRSTPPQDSGRSPHTSKDMGYPLRPSASLRALGYTHYPLPRFQRNTTTVGSRPSVGGWVPIVAGPFGDPLLPLWFKSEVLRSLVLSSPIYGGETAHTYDPRRADDSISTLSAILLGKGAALVTAADRRVFLGWWFTGTLQDYHTVLSTLRAVTSTFDATATLIRYMMHRELKSLAERHRGERPGSSTSSPAHTPGPARITSAVSRAAGVIYSLATDDERAELLPGREISLPWIAAWTGFRSGSTCAPPPTYITKGRSRQSIKSELRARLARHIDQTGRCVGHFRTPPFVARIDPADLRGTFRVLHGVVLIGRTPLRMPDSGPGFICPVCARAELSRDHVLSCAVTAQELSPEAAEIIRHKPQVFRWVYSTIKRLRTWHYRAIPFAREVGTTCATIDAILTDCSATPRARRRAFGGIDPEPLQAPLPNRALIRRRPDLRHNWTSPDRPWQRARGGAATSAPVLTSSDRAWTREDLVGGLPESAHVLPIFSDGNCLAEAIMALLHTADWLDLPDSVRSVTARAFRHSVAAAPPTTASLCHSHDPAFPYDTTLKSMAEPDQPLPIDAVALFSAWLEISLDIYVLYDSSDAAFVHRVPANPRNDRTIRGWPFAGSLLLYRPDVGAIGTEDAQLERPWHWEPIFNKGTHSTVSYGESAQQTNSL